MVSVCLCPGVLALAASFLAVWKELGRPCLGFRRCPVGRGGRPARARAVGSERLVGMGQSASLGQVASVRGCTVLGLGRGSSPGSLGRGRRAHRERICAAFCRQYSAEINRSRPGWFVLMVWGWGLRSAGRYAFTGRAGHSRELDRRRLRWRGCWGAGGPERDPDLLRQAHPLAATTLQRAVGDGGCAARAKHVCVWL